MVSPIQVIREKIPVLGPRIERDGNGPGVLPGTHPPRNDLDLGREIPLNLDAPVEPILAGSFSLPPHFLSRTTTKSTGIGLLSLAASDTLTWTENFCLLFGKPGRPLGASLSFAPQPANRTDTVTKTRHRLKAKAMQALGPRCPAGTIVDPLNKPETLYFAGIWRKSCSVLDRGQNPPES